MLDNVYMRPKTLQLVDQKGDLPPLPEVMLRLEAKVDDPDVDIEEIALIIESEPVLAGKQLNLSNSVFLAADETPSKTLPGPF